MLKGAKRKFQPPRRVAGVYGGGLNKAGPGPPQPKEEAGEEKWEVLYAKKGPKKRVAWHDGVLEKRVTGTGMNRWCLTDASSSSVVGRAAAAASKSVAEEGEEEDKLIPGYRIQVGAKVGAKRAPLAELPKQPVLARQAVRVPSAKRSKQAPAFAVPGRVMVGSGGFEKPTTTVGAPAAMKSSVPSQKNKLATRDADAFEITASPRVALGSTVARKLRPHQLEGVAFLYKALRGVDGRGGGAILADSMGLGKTLTTLALLRVLAKAAGCANDDVACRKLRKAVILCPATVVSNWIAENVKWFGRVSSNVVLIPALEAKGGKRDGSTETAKEAVERWAALDGRAGCKILVVSYETALRHSTRIFEDSQLDGVVADEGHRLKNPTSKMTRLVHGCRAKKRLLITGTPAMNDLDEFYVLADLVEPGVFGDLANFRADYVRAIDRGAKADASFEDGVLAERATTRVRTLARHLYLRRDASQIKRDHMPPKTHHVVCCAMTSHQRRAYLDVCRDVLTTCANALGGDGTATLAAIQRLRALATRGDVDDRPSNDDDDDPRASGKLLVLTELVAAVLETTDDKIVLVSTSTRTLDVLQAICRGRRWRFARLDGATAADDRGPLVSRFNSRTNPDRIFLLSSRAGGCGINLIGANRLVLVDADWNPALDEQAMARVWRDGQTKPVHIYRFLTSASIDEVMVQRQLAKHDLADGVVDGAAVIGRFSKDQLRDLFTLVDAVPSTTAAALDWPAYTGPDALDQDPALQQAARHSRDLVTYVYSHLHTASEGDGAAKPATKKPRRVVFDDDLDDSDNESPPPESLVPASDLGGGPTKPATKKPRRVVFDDDLDDSDDEFPPSEAPLPKTSTSDDEDDASFHDSSDSDDDDEIMDCTT